MLPDNTATTLKYLPEKGGIERGSFPKMVERGELMFYPYCGDWWFIDSIKDLKALEEELQVG